jgi:hypothetical protein
MFILFFMYLNNMYDMDLHKHYKYNTFKHRYGDMMALGHGKDEDQPVPKKISFKQDIHVTLVAGGGQHSAVIGKVRKTN